MQRVLCWLFAKVYRRWLWNEFYNNYDRVLKVHGWRTATVASVGKSGREVHRYIMAPCFWIFQ
jgi:hypothetical protein